MSASSTAAAAVAPSTIHVIVSLHENVLPTIQLKFLVEKLNWDNLVSLIQSSSALEPPVVLYYKLAFDAPIETLENQENLSQLLSVLDSPTCLRFYGDQEHVVSPVFVSSTAAFTRLGALVDQNKHVVQSSRRIARWVGILATMLATSDKTFEHEFQVLEKLIQRKAVKLQRRNGNLENKEPAETDGVVSAAEDEEFGEAAKVIDLNARLDGLDINGHPGFGGRCGRGFGFGGRGGRGGFSGSGSRRGGPCRPHPYEFFEGFLGGAGGKFGGDFDPKDFEKSRQAFAQFLGGRHHDHHHDRPHPLHGGSSDSEGETGFGKFGGRHHGHHHHHRHHHGRPHPFGGPHLFGSSCPLGGSSDSEEDVFGPYRNKHFGCRGGRGGFGPGFGPRGPPPAFDSDEEFFGGPGFGGPGFGGAGFGDPHGFGGRHQFSKHGKHHCK
ncbi:hypothetical protein PS15m_007524 [Mucor circinelloides]